ncbi:MAG TPA: ribosomal protein S18-alanine N-acetyltransferase [Terriglobales bacterium]|nr:ribosomal protein S18-alanine N-acetyltransferase [Terriglobales bacterium]
MKLSIRPADSTDLLAMLAIEKHAATAAHWSIEQYEALFRASGQIALIVQEETQQEKAQVQGFIIARAIGVEWEIENIALAGPARRRGLGTRLLGEFLDLARAQGAEAVFLEVRESNRAARALYEKWSFMRSGRRQKYYKDPEEDAILYRHGFA